MSNKVMDGCSWEEKEEGVSIAITTYFEHRHQGRVRDLDYLVGIMRMRRTHIKYVAKGGKRALHLSLNHTSDGNDEEDQLREVLAVSTPARQLRIVEAKEALAMCMKLPKKIRAVLLRRADGANPIEIAAELSLEIEDVLTSLADARKWIEGQYV